jgi:predicted permease
MRHIKFAFRTLFKSPFVTTVAILSLALGIGANAAMYSLFDQTLLRAVPVPDAGRLVDLKGPGPQNGSNSCSMIGGCDEVFSYAMFQDLQKSQTVLSGLAAHRDASFSISYDQQPTNVRGLLISGSYFPTLELNPAAGRLIGPSDDTPVGANFVVVLGYNFWISRFGGDPAIVGKTMIVNGQTMTIIGVAPKGFQSTSLSVDPQVFAPISMRHELSPWFHDFENRRSYWIYLFGRMKPGVTIAQAEAGLNKVYKPLINDVEAPLQKGMSEQTLAKFKAKEVKLEDGRRGQSVIHQEAKTPMTLLLGITVIVLLIACANIANLLLARGANRAMEMGVRLALGASRRQLLTQLITESLLLAAMGGIASLFVAQWTLRAVSTMLPNDGSATLTFSLEPRILLFAAALSVVTGFLFGLFPALHSTRGDLVTTIRSNAGQISGHRTAARFRSSLVTAQIALSMALLIAAGLFMKSLANISRVDLGLHVDDVIAFGMSPERAGYDSTRAQLFYAQVEERLAAIPGVTGVTSSMVPLLAGDNWGNSVKVQGYPTGPDVDNNSRMNEVGGGYFHMLGIKMLAGRDLTTADARGAAKVVVVNESFAKKFKLGNDVVGKYMSLGSGEHDSLDVQIVGLVQNAKYSDVKDSVPPVYYRPWRQNSNATYMNFYVRGSLPPSELLRAIPAAMRRLDATVPVEDLKTMPQQIKENVSLDRMISILSASFAVLATLLAAVGLYGVLAYTVAQRTREIGVRMALGANSSSVQLMVMRQVGWMMLIGGTIGLAAAYGLGRAAASLLYQLSSFDPVVFVIAIVTLAIVASGAGWLPARKASKVDPIKALRYE